MKRKKMKMKREEKEEEEEVVVKGKKLFDLPGQKHETPSEREPLRIFYETLYRQLPNNEMAAVWMMEWGLLPADEAKKIYKNLKKHRQQKLGSPVKAVSMKKPSKVFVEQEKEVVGRSMPKTKKRKVNAKTLGDSEDRSISPKRKAKKQSTYS